MESNHVATTLNIMSNGYIAKFKTSTLLDNVLVVQCNIDDSITTIMHAENLIQENP
jgi:hypothetical protein